MKFFFYFIVLSISVLTVINNDISTNYVETFIEESLLNISRIGFAFIFAFLLVVLSFFGISISILAFSYFLFLDLRLAFLFSFTSIIISGISAYFFLSKSKKEVPFLVKYEDKLRKYKIYSPYFPVVLRLIPGVPFMAQNIILIELKHSFNMYLISLCIASFLSSSIFYLLFLIL